VRGKSVVILSKWSYFILRIDAQIILCDFIFHDIYNLSIFPYLIFPFNCFIIIPAVKIKTQFFNPTIHPVWVRREKISAHVSRRLKPRHRLTLKFDTPVLFVFHVTSCLGEMETRDTIVLLLFSSSRLFSMRPAWGDNATRILFYRKYGRLYICHSLS